MLVFGGGRLAPLLDGKNPRLEVVVHEESDLIPGQSHEEAAIELKAEGREPLGAPRSKGAGRIIEGILVVGVLVEKEVVEFGRADKGKVLIEAFVAGLEAGPIPAGEKAWDLMKGRRQESLAHKGPALLGGKVHPLIKETAVLLEPVLDGGWWRMW